MEFWTNCVASVIIAAKCNFFTVFGAIRQDHGNVQGRQLAGDKRREEHPRLVPATAPHYNLVHELHEMGIIRVVHVPGKEKEADFLTKTNITEMKFKQVAHTLSSNGEKFLKKIHSSMLSTCKTSSFRDLKSGI